MITKILTDRVNFAKDVNEVRQQWLHGLFLYVGLDADGMLEAPRDKTIEYMISNGIEVIEYKGIEALMVKMNGELIGEWAGPEYKLREDPKDKSLYFEVTIEHWSLEEDDISSE